MHFLLLLVILHRSVEISFLSKKRDFSYLYSYSIDSCVGVALAEKISKNNVVALKLL